MKSFKLVDLAHGQEIPCAGVYARVATVLAGVTVYSETVVSGSYYYRVQAFNSVAGRLSAYSNAATANVKGR